MNANKGKWFHIKKTRSRRHSAETMTEADNADDPALLSNTPAQVEFLL